MCVVKISRCADVKWLCSKVLLLNFIGLERVVSELANFFKIAQAGARTWDLLVLIYFLSQCSARDPLTTMPPGVCKLIFSFTKGRHFCSSHVSLADPFSCIKCCSINVNQTHFFQIDTFFKASNLRIYCNTFKN